MTHPAGRAVLPTEAGWDQLVYAESGAMTVSTSDAAGTVPVHRALWIPGSAPVTVINRSPVAVRTLYFASSLGALPGGDVRAVNVPACCARCCCTPSGRARCDLEQPVQAALVTVLVDQLRRLPDEPLRLPWPTDPRAADAASAIMADPWLDLDTVAGRVSASRRTLERALRRRDRAQPGRLATSGTHPQFARRARRRYFGHQHRPRGRLHHPSAYVAAPSGANSASPRASSSGHSRPLSVGPAAVAVAVEVHRLPRRQHERGRVRGVVDQRHDVTPGAGLHHGR